MTLASPKNHNFALWVLSAVLISSTLWGCGGGGGTIPSSTMTVRALPASFTSAQAVAYSPYRTSNRDSETITKDMIAQDLVLLGKAGIGLIRLFDSSDAVAKKVLEVITEQNLTMKVMLGLWMSSGDSAETGNQQEIARGIALANAYKAQVLAVSVGNETLVSWSGQRQTASNLLRYIQQVRNAVTQPVTTDDNWAVLAQESTEQDARNLLASVDFVAMHTYPLLDTIHSPRLWDWQQQAVPEADRAVAMMDAAIARAKFEFSAVKSKLTALGLTQTPIVIGETGWKAVPSGNEVQRASPINQKMYWERLKTWKASGTGPANIVYFAGFDEPWKGSDDKWGLFNVARQARCAVQGLSNDFVAETGSCAAADAARYVAVSSNTRITANRYTVYADTVTNGEAKPAVTPVLNAWESGTTATATGSNNDADANDGPNSWQITPRPLVWGWGMTFAIDNSPDDLSNFDTGTGRLNFSIKTTYPGKIEVGFLTGTAADSSLYDVYLSISPGQYGYANDGQWREVSIPIAAIKAAGAKAYGMENSVASVFDLSKVTNPFVIADRYAKTSNSPGVTTTLKVDAIYWSK